MAHVIDGLYRFARTVDPNQLVALKQIADVLVEDSIPIEEDGWSSCLVDDGAIHRIMMHSLGVEAASASIQSHNTPCCNKIAVLQ